MITCSKLVTVPASTTKKWASAVCFALAFSIAGFTVPTDGTVKDGSSVRSQKPVLRIVAFGSSSTQGVGASAPAATYPAQLQTILATMMPKGRSVEVVNRGIGGEDVDDMMNRLQADVIDRKPDLVIWQTGSNDPLRDVPLDRFEAETREGVKAMRQAGAEVMLMEPQWCPMIEKTGKGDGFRDAIRRVAAELNVPVIHRADLMHKWVEQGRMTRSQMLSGDGLHMADTGYAALAHDIAPDVLKASASVISTPVALRSK